MSSPFQTRTCRGICVTSVSPVGRQAPEAGPCQCLICYFSPQECFATVLWAFRAKSVSLLSWVIEHLQSQRDIIFPGACLTTGVCHWRVFAPATSPYADVHGLCAVWNPQSPGLRRDARPASPQPLRRYWLPLPYLVSCYCSFLRFQSVANWK